MSKAYDNAKELEYISFDSTNNKINFSVAISTNGAAVAASVYDANTTSNGSFTLPAGNTASRPASPANGAIRYNTTIGAGEMYFEQSGWASFVGEPLITDVTPGTFNGTSGTEFEITGVRFDQDAQIYFVAANGTSYLAGSTAFYSPTRIIATTPRPFTVAYEPLSVKIVQNSGTYTKQNVIDCGGVPSWVTTAGTLGSIFGGNTVNVYVSATEPEGNSITYTIASGTLPTGLTLTSANGLIQGFNTGATTNTTYNFTITASDSVNNTDRAFSYIIFNRPPVFNTASNLLITDNEIDTYVANTTINAYDPDGGVITYNLDSGSVPSGMTFVSANGALVGAPTRVDSNTTSTFTVTITDVGNLSNTRTFNLTITTDTDPHFANTVLLLKTTSSNTVIKDVSSNNLPITVTGDARASNFNPFNTSWSTYFGTYATDSYLTYVPGTSVAFGTGDFTIECWAYWDTDPGSTANPYIIDTRGGGGAWAFSWNWAGTSSGSVLAWTKADGTNHQSSTQMPLRQWNHCAYVRSGTTGIIYLNGVSILSFTDSTNYSASISLAYLGKRFSGNQANPGYLSNLRIVKGTAVYASAFTPPTSKLTAIVNTVLLTCQSNAFKDNSTANSGTGFTITSSGIPKNVGRSPFEETDTANGSMYFDGSGDYILTSSTTSMNLGTNDFCLEFWFYANSVSGTYNGLCGSATDYKGPSISRYGSKLMYGLSSTGSSWNVLAAEGSVGSIDIIVGQWYHFALCRSGTTISGYLNGRRDITTTSSASLISRTEGFSFGSWFPGSYVWNGFISNARFVNGSTPYDPTQTSITVPTSPLTVIANTKLLTLQNRQSFNNHTFQDNSSNKHIVTRFGNATQGTFTPFSQTGWSNYFNGSSTISFGSSSALNILAYDTFECWVNMPVIGTNDLIAGRDGNFWMGYNFTGIGGAANKFVFTIYNGSSWQAVSSTTTPVVGTWYHLLGVKDNTTMRFYVNGVQENTSTFSGSPVTTGTFYVASNNNVENFEGYISNLRLITGASNTIFPYSGLTTGGSFTPPTSALTAVTGTALLTCQSNRFVDNSNNNFSATITSIPSVQAFSPFKPNSAYSIANTGGSVYLDGSGDYLSVLNNSDFDMTGTSYCFETWVYFTDTKESSIFNRFDGTGGPGISIQRLSSAGGQDRKVIFYTGSQLNGVVPLYEYQWYHIAFTFDGTTKRIFVNGALDASTTTGTMWQNSSSLLNLYIGNRQGDGRSFDFPGYMSGTRVTKGSAVYTSAFTPPTSPPILTGNTSLLLNYTDAGIYDSASKNVLETVGNAQVSTTQAKWGTTSMYFDGTGDYLTVPNGPIVAIGSGNFTIEGWWYPTDLSATTHLWCLGDERSTYNGLLLYWSSGSGSLILYSNGSPIITSSILTPINSWYFVSVVRSGTTITLYVNGSSAGTVTNSTSFTGIVANGFCVNAEYAGSFGVGKAAYYSDLRITKYARYTANFTPPTKTFAKA